ncbi:unnamed protein product [Owenia fusiformis]|uniref:Uncharacterized protein n=1 Tax=Owenia fusiformis TaxID=6347 RepID=A0A8J1U4I1_OWEFU|nr:unnamed protein product [Owenia fusiformis]
MEFNLRMALFCVIATLLIAPLEGFRYFQNKIPNGNNIPHPCKPNYVWQGVGHRNSAGGGERNPFGLAFDENGKVWTPELCNADSDNDGRTNGQELGDPNCVWNETQIPEETSGLTHPGICEPWNSPACLAQNQWEFCNSQEFSCPPMDATADVRNVTVRFPPTPVPSEETSYICLTVPLPDDGDYHLIAQTPIINNTNVMHHMLLYGCRDEELVEGDGDVRTRFQTPKSCKMGVGCNNILAKWALGASGECSSEKAAFRIGTKGYKTAILQVHWNNPEFRQDYVDSSGMTLYYTPNLREFDAGYLMTGQQYITIPGGQPSYITSAVAESYCTQQYLQSPIYLTESLLHMHYLGKSASLDHYRDGSRVGSLGRDDVYSYDSPVTHKFGTPIEFQPGDEIRLKCEFDSTSKNTTTYYGDATSDEMCYSFVVYYPEVKNMNSIIQFKNASLCKGVFSKTCPDIQDYMEGDGLKNLWWEVVNNCDTDIGGRCLPECEKMVRRMKSTDGCMSDSNVVELMKTFLESVANIDSIWRGFESCDDVIALNESVLCNDLATYMNQTLKGVAEQIVDSCDVMGNNCQPECKEMIQEIRRTDACLGNQIMATLMKTYTAQVPDIHFFWQAFESCDEELAPVRGKECNLEAYMEQNIESFAAEVSRKCDMEVGGTCKPECKVMVKKARETDECLGNPKHVETMKFYTLPYEGMDYVWRGFESCDDELELANQIPPDDDEDDDMTGSASGISLVFTAQLLAGFLTIFFLN